MPDEKVPEWLKNPWYVPWSPRGGRKAKYRRWTAEKEWPWYAPEAYLEKKPWAAVINRLLPYMGEEDVPTVARQLYTAGGGAKGPFKTYLDTPRQTAPTAPAVPAPPQGGGYRKTLKSIRQTLNRIPNKAARNWARSVFDVYEDWTGKAGIRSTEDEAVFAARLEEMFEAVPESAQPYAAALQRIVQPTVRRPGREWYEMPAYRRTAPTNWRALGYEFNPQWR